MSKVRSLEAFLSEAKEKEKKYDWLGAVESYVEAQTSALKQENFQKAGDIEEGIGFCFFRAAMQAKSQEEFWGRMRLAFANYGKAKEFYERLSEPGKKPRILRCDAMIAYLGYWHTSEVSEKKRLMDECWRLTKLSLRAFEKAGDAWEYGKTYNQLSTSALFGLFLEWDYQAREKTTKEASEYGEQVIRFLSPFGDLCELARAYVKTATYLQLFGFYFLNLDEREKYYQKATGYWQKANELSEKTALIELLNSAAMATLESDWGWGTDEAITNFRRALKYGRKTKDKFIVGWALSWLAFHISLKLGERGLYSDEGIEILKTALQYAEDAKHQFCQISFVSPLWGALWVEAPLAEYYWDLATWETNLGKRSDLLEKAKEAASDQLKRAEDSGYPEVIMFAHIEFSMILFSLAMIETNSEDKKGLLEKALGHRNEAIRINEQFLPFFYWYRGFNQNHLASIKSELADLAKDPESKKNMLQEAILDKESSLKLCIKHTTFWEGKGSIPPLLLVLGAWQYGYGGLLNRLYGFTNDREHLRKAIKAFEESADSFQKFNLTSRMAECYWKVAQTHDALGEHLKAAENFDLASNNYKRAAENIPQLKNFYREHALYMQAWTEIERAKHHHTEKHYGQAEEHYENAANLHESTKRWNYLSPNYLAWARLEEAEDLSKREQTEVAKDLFQKAAELFVEAKKSVRAKLERIEVRDEKQMLAELVKASDVRREYCLGRIALEEAKILDRQGDHMPSSRKYGSAATIFKEIAKAESEQGRKELQAIVYLCQAWQKMMMAEARASPIMYEEAAELFKQAMEHSLDQPTSLLALANSSFCKALEAGTEFEITRDLTMYSTAKKHLEVAANYYLKAGFENASEYVRATQHLFDAYMYQSKAETETEPRKKAQYYRMAGKLLQASAGSYMKAKHPEKSEEVYRLLESVKEERQLAMALTEVLHVPAAASSTTSFSLPTSIREEAVGLERFDHVNIQAYLTSSDEITVGEELEVRLDLVNVAKNSGLLVRVDNLIPRGFKVTKLPVQFRLENGSIYMKGKKLEPIKVEAIKILMEPTEAGVFDLCPKVVYTDEVGKFLTCRPQAVQITVRAPLLFKFKTEAAGRAFNYLVRAFIEDYMKRRLFIQEAGWRSLVQISRNARVSLRSVYGSGGRRGSAISELERRGLVETRIFPGERGRGGRIVKARISYEKETIKRYVDRKVARN